MDGENHGLNPIYKWDDLGGKPTIFGKHPIVTTVPNRLYRLFVGCIDLF